MTHPLTARLVLLAAAAALAASLAFAIVMAELRDVDGRAGAAATAPLLVDALRAEPAQAVPVRVRVAAP